MYSYAFFDLDGTLTQSEFGILEGSKRALTHFGIDISDEAKLRKFIGPPLHVSFHDNYGLSEEDTEEAIRFYDIEAAVDVGVDSIGVLYGYGEREELEKAGATYLVNDVPEIRGIILG